MGPWFIVLMKLLSLGWNLFEGIYKEEGTINIEKVINITSFFQSFVEEKDNERLLEVV